MRHGETYTHTWRPTIAGLPHYLPATRGNALSQDKLIETYINLGFAAQETVLFLASVRGLCFTLKLKRKRSK